MTDETRRVIGGGAQAIVSLAGPKSVGTAGLLGVFSSDGGWRAPILLSGIHVWPFRLPSSTASGT